MRWVWFAVSTFLLTCFLVVIASFVEVKYLWLLGGTLTAVFLTLFVVDRILP